MGLVVRQLKIYPVGWAKHPHGEIAEPIWSGNRFSEDAPDFFFHRYAVSGSTHAESYQRFLIQLSHAQARQCPLRCPLDWENASTR